MTDRTLRCFFFFLLLLFSFFFFLFSQCGLRSKDKETQFKKKLTCVTSKQELITSEESLITEQDECITKAKNNEFEMSEEDQATIARHKKQKEAHTKLLQALMDLRAHIGDDKELSIPDHLKDSFRFASTSASIEPRFKAMISMISDLASKESEPTKNALVDALLALLDQLIGQLKKTLNLDDSAAEMETKEEELQRKRADEMTTVCTKKRTETQTKIATFKSEITQCESELNIISSEMKEQLPKCKTKHDNFAAHYENFNDELAAIENMRNILNGRAKPEVIDPSKSN